MSDASLPDRGRSTPSIPAQSLGALFGRFLRFGFLAWGGPVAQIAMLRRELVDREGWITSERFNRTLAVYQALPGPEAHELCVYFGYLARGRWGGFVAGLGFMLPGFLLILAASWFYVAVGIDSPWFAAAFAGCQAAVLALIVRAAHRIGVHSVTDPWLAIIAGLAFGATMLDASFVAVLVAAGLGHLLMSRGRTAARLVVTVVLAAMVGFTALAGGPGADAPEPVIGPSVAGEASGVELMTSGLRAGLLTFGGAYTAIPFVQRDAVEEGGWMPTATFLDGVALSGVLPAPLIIFVAFVGFVAGGLLGALVITAAAFAPAFAITLVGHRYLERIVGHAPTHSFLDGVMAGVVGLIGATALLLAPDAFQGPASVVIFAGALAMLALWRAPMATAVTVLASGVAGLALFGALAAG